MAKPEERSEVVEIDATSDLPGTVIARGPLEG
jgi:hypothetical protein